MFSKYSPYIFLVFPLTILLPAVLYAEYFSNPATQETVAQEAEFQKTPKISLSLKEANVLDVFKMFSEKTGWNLVMGEEVSGKISLSLHEVTIEEALAAVLDVSGYAIRRKGDILLVKSREQMEGASFPKVAEHKTYQLNYAGVEETAEVIKKYLSATGRLTIHKSRNALIIEDIPETFDKIAPLLHDLDRLPEQVLIEAKIMEVRLNDDLSFGVDWNAAFSAQRMSGTVQTSGFSAPPEAGTPGFFFSLTTPEVNVFLDALQQKGLLNTLATPKLLTMNHKSAQIVVGGRLGYRVTTTTNQVTTESVEFLDIGTQLRIVPHIDDQGNILMEIHPEVSDGVVTAGLPSKTTTEVTTALLARDGETVFIGGLIRERQEEIKDQVPVLGSIPLLGHLFKRTEIKNSKTEIIVLITPHLGKPVPERKPEEKSIFDGWFR